MASSDEENTVCSDNDSDSVVSDDSQGSQQVTKQRKKRRQSAISQKPKKVKYDHIPTDSSMKKKAKNEFYKPPTVEELNNLKMTENLYNSNLFRLQIDELLKEVTIKSKRKKALNSWLENVKNVIDNLPEYDLLLSEIKPVTRIKNVITKREKFINSLSTTFSCVFTTDQDLKLHFEKPEGFECFGLFENNTLPGPQLETSINVTMPKTCFHTKDFLNNRYLVKRFYYLAYIAENIPTYQTHIVFHENNILLPILRIQPTEDEKLIVNLYATPPDNYFKPSRFLPSQNNVKQDVFKAQISDNTILKSSPTIFYNSTLAHDVTLKENCKYIKTTLNEHNNIQEGIKLLCIWLKQRELDCGYGGFTSTLVTYIVTYMLAKKKLNKFMSSYQVIRNFWSFLATTGLENNPISLAAESPSAEMFELFKKHFSLVLLDRTNCFNLGTFLNLNIFRKVIQECELAMKHLDGSAQELFHSLFLTKLPFNLQYDVVLDLSLCHLEDQFVATDLEKAKHIGYQQFLFISHLSELLHKGLHKRALNIVPYIGVQYPSSDVKKLTFGITLNPETAFKFIELGPALNDFAKADEFRKFWGYLSSDRRFRDGSSHVAVYFKTSTARGKRGIIKRIIKYLLMEKMKLEFKLYYDEFEEYLLNKKVVCPYPVGTNEENTLKIITVADELNQKLRSMQMSLSITGIQGISDAFSYCEVFPPVATKFRPAENVTEIKGKNVIFSNKKVGMIPMYVEPLEMVLQLEHSSKWPNDLEAVRHVKTSFYLEISKMLYDKHKVISNVTKEYLEVFYQGLVFRYKLYVPKEVSLMKKGIAEDGAVVYTDNAESVEYEKTLDVLPKVNAALKGLQLQFPSFGPGTTLIKRWMRAHLIDEWHFPDIVINLLNASLYLNTTCFTESCTPQISFLRFWKLIAEFQWKLQPLIVNFNEEISKEDIADLESKFQQNRDALQPLYIIMPYDQGQSLFTKNSPSKYILGLIQALAEVSLNLIMDRRLSIHHLVEQKVLFKPDINAYNLLIHLRPLLNPRRHEQLENAGDSKIVLEPYEHHKNETIPIAGFNPVDLYLKTLRKNYGDFATFFHDTYGGNTICVLWNPNVQDAKEFKVSCVGGRKLVDNKLVLNEDAIIEDFFILGKGIVKWIEKKQ